VIEPAEANPADMVRLARDALERGQFAAADDYATRALHVGSGGGDSGDDDETRADALRPDDLWADGTWADDPRTRAEALWLLAQAGTGLGELERAETFFHAALESFAALGDTATVGKIRGGLGRVLLRAGRHASAADELQAAVSILPGDLELQLELAHALRLVPQPQAANAVLGQILTIAPAMVEALILRGVINAQFGDPTSALYDLNNAVRLLPSAAGRPDVERARAQSTSRLARWGQS
jgi:tetratricopeptide (TPR) repeat protein